MGKLTFDKEAFKKYWIYLVGVFILLIFVGFTYYKILTLPRNTWSTSDNLITILFTMSFVVILIFYLYDRERLYERIGKLERKRK